MKQRDLGKSVMQLLSGPDNGPMTANRVSEALELSGSDRKKIHKVLSRLVMNGELARDDHEQYFLGHVGDLIEGKVIATKSGITFVLSDDASREVLIPRKDIGGAMPGDRVVARVARTAANRHRSRKPGPPDDGREKAVGRIVRIVERGRQSFVGVFNRQRGLPFVMSLDAGTDRVNINHTMGANAGDRVVVELTEQPDRTGRYSGRVVEVIGPVDNPSLDTITIMKHYGYSREFPPEVMADAESAKAFTADPGKRLDLRDRFLFTVDPVDARDFDDALSLETDGKGNRVLGVHIADVSHYVRPGTAIDHEARRRGNSAYFPDTVIPMLPKALSNGICSLMPNEDRLSFSVFMTLDNEGRRLDFRFERSLMRSALRLTYPRALAVLRSKKGSGDKEVSDEQADVIRRIGELAQQIRRRRFAQHALNLDVPECEVKVDPEGRVMEVVIEENDESHQMIEECMVAANESVDTALSNRGFKLIHRVHEPPSEEKIAILTTNLVHLGLRPGDLRDRANMASFLRSIEDSPMRDFVRTMVLRSMKKAVYSVSPKGHFGLAKKFYAHFTSPIRRYPDLVVHRILGAMIDSTATPYQADELAAVALNCSFTEQSSEKAERQLVEIKKFRYLQDEIDSRKPVVRHAVVVGVVGFGMFVEVRDLRVQGLIPVSAIRKASSGHRNKAPVIYAGNKTYRVGTAVDVIVTSVDMERRRLDFALAGEEPRESKWRRPKTGRR